MTSYNNKSNKIIKIDSVIRNSLENYDLNQVKINNFLKQIKYIQFIDNYNNIDQIIFYDKNKKIIFKSAYEIMGIFIPQTKIWKWSWSIPSLHNKFTLISRKILEYAFNLDPVKEYILRSELINSKIKIINDIQLDIHIALSSYISKKPFIFKFLNKYYNEDEYNNSTSSNNEILYEYDILNDNDNDKYMNIYIFILDYN